MIRCLSTCGLTLAVAVSIIAAEALPEAAPVLPFTVSITPTTSKELPEYFDNVKVVSKDLSFYQDWPVSPIVIDGEFWVMQKCGYSDTVVRYKGTTIENAVRQPDGRLNITHPDWGTVVAPYILGGMWYDRTTKKLFAPMHCEYQGMYYTTGDSTGTKLNRQIHLAVSADKGLTWQYEGPIVTRDDPRKPRTEAEYSGARWDGGEGDFYLYADERSAHVYLFTNHNLWPKPGENGPRFWAHHVARCAFKDKMAPGKWRKFYEGKWSEPALGGKASYVEAANVIYSSSLKKYISFNLGGGVSACDDLAKQDWTPSFHIPGAKWGNGELWAWTLVDASKANVSKFDRKMFVYTYWHGQPGSAHQVEFSDGAMPNGSGFTGSGVTDPGFAHTMIPTRPYGEPMYDNTDKIESRRVRKVGCEHAEMRYTGEWIAQESPVRAKCNGVANGSVAFEFKGTGIYWRAATGPDCGMADVYLDETLQKTVDLYGDFTPYQFGFIKTDLAQGTHTVKIVVSGKKNAKSSGTAVKHMSFEYAADSYQAADGFCSIMGKNQWSYQFLKGATYGNLSFDFRTNVWKKDQGAVTVGSDRQTPDDTYAAVRTWAAPHAGSIRVEGVVSSEGAGSDGVNAKILHNKVVVWGPVLVSSGKSSRHDIKIEVARGDDVYFQVDKNITNVNDAAAWNPMVTFIEP
jgi:hypothetical protein